MLRILAGSLLSGTLLSGAVASSFLTVPPMRAGTGPSFQVIDENRKPARAVDPSITARYGDDDEPQVITAPRYVTVSNSISAMTPSLEELPATTSIAAIGEEPVEPDETPPAPQQAQALDTMVIRGGLVGLAFPASTPASKPDEAEGSDNPTPVE
ncbi:MAG: hypothetical protein MEQ84_01100 [Mesorhizobium sp.]|nr:hypothetical protein [Mesorhizobium sp.]